jgi:hypothetical protein
MADTGKDRTPSPDAGFECQLEPNGEWKISPTDISQYTRLDQCRRYLRLRLYERMRGLSFMYNYGVTPQAIPPMLTRSGREFEERVEQAVAERFRTINFARQANSLPNPGSRGPDNQQVVQLARDLQPGEAIYLFQPRITVHIAGWQMSGDIDILRMERDGSAQLRLLISDAKSSTTAKVEHRLQVAFYRVMLAALLEQHGVPFASIDTAILYRGTPDPADSQDVASATDTNIDIEEQRRAAVELFGVDDAFLEVTPDPDAYLQSVEDLVTGPQSVARQVAVMPFEEVPFHLDRRCDNCLYNEFCMKWSAERDDLSLLPHLTALDKEALRRAGVRTVRDLALLKEPRPTTPGVDAQSSSGPELVPAPGREALVARLAATWPVGPRLDELVCRARAYRRWKGDPLAYPPYIPSGGHGSLPYCDRQHNPNLVRVYVDAAHDYLHDRVYMLGALVAACEQGEEHPHRRRAIVHISDGPPDSPHKEEQLLVRWIADTLRAIVELAAPDHEGRRSAPIHLIFYDRASQSALLDALGRHLANIFGATPLFDFLTQMAAYDSPIASFLEDEIRELKNYPMVCQSLQSVAAYLKFDWNRPQPYRQLFRERMFDFWGKLDEQAVPEGQSRWYTSRARFGSQIPLEYAYAAWGQLPEPPPGPPREDEFAPYRHVTLDLLRGFEERRLEAIEHIARDFRGNYLTQKTPFNLPDLAQFEEKAPTLAHALREFLAIERHVELAEWKSARNTPPERRVLMGETLLVRYVEADQPPEVAEANREHLARHRLREQYEAAYRAQHPGDDRVRLSREQKKQTEWSNAGLSFVLRLETEGIDAGVDEVLGLTNLREGERVVVFPRYVTDSRLPPEQRTLNTPTPKQMLYGARATITAVTVERDEADRALSACVQVRMEEGMQSTLKGFTFGSFNKYPFEDGGLYTLDSDPNDIYGYWCWTVVEELCRRVAAAPDPPTFAHTGNALYDRLVAHAGAPLSRPLNEAEGLRFFEGLEALHRAGALHDFEESKRLYIGGHFANPILLVQGPPGTGKSYTTAFAVLARVQAAMAEGRPFRVLLSCKTHAATDVLLEKMRYVQRDLREKSHTHPDIFDRYFDRRVLDVPLMRLDPKEAREDEAGGVIVLARRKNDGDEVGRVGGGPLHHADAVQGHMWCVAAATPGAVYKMIKARWGGKDLFGHYMFQCAVLDEASQMNLPEAIMASLSLDPNGQLIVVGDHRQMPPIVRHDWASERRRTFQQYKTYRSLFETLLDIQPPPPVIRFAESFRLHADMAEFLRREIYSRDGIPYHSHKRSVLRRCQTDDPFVAAVLSPDHPIVVVVHDEERSQSRNPFERALMEPVLRAMADPRLLSLDPLSGLGVVVPHRAQRADFQSALPLLVDRDPNTGAIRYSAVDTVERFQGGERTAIVVSATESDRDYLMAASDFMYDPRRLTVAISRAKEKLVLVASRSVFSLFSPDEEAFHNAQLWKNLLRRTCTVKLWEGERLGHHVQVWGNASANGSASGGDG